MSSTRPHANRTASSHKSPEKKRLSRGGASADLSELELSAAAAAATAAAAGDEEEEVEEDKSDDDEDDGDDDDDGVGREGEAAEGEEDTEADLAAEAAAK